MSTHFVPTREQVLELSDLTLAAYLRHLAPYGGAPEDADGLVCFAGAHRQPRETLGHSQLTNYARYVVPAPSPRSAANGA